MGLNELLILYETFTGTCKAYAEKLAQSLLGEKKRLSEFDGVISARTVVVLVPVHAQSVPKKVISKLKTCNFEGCNVVAIIVYGGVSSGSALLALTRLIKKSGGTVVGAAECVAEHSYSVLNGSAPNGSTESRCQTEDAQAKLCEFVKTAMVQEKSVNFKSFKRKSNLFSHLPKRMLAALSVRLPIIERHEKCTNCGLCATQCPLSAIDTQKRINKAKCVRCLHCVRICPAKARRAKFSQPFVRGYINKKRNCKDKFYLSSPI